LRGVSIFSKDSRKVVCLAHTPFGHCCFLDKRLKLKRLPFFWVALKKFPFVISHLLMVCLKKMTALIRSNACALYFGEKRKEGSHEARKE